MEESVKEQPKVESFFGLVNFQKDQLRPPVRQYADNLEKQTDEGVKRLGFEDSNKFLVSHSARKG